MGLFIIACGVVVAVGLLTRAQHPERAPVVPVGAWLALLALGSSGFSTCLLAGSRAAPWTSLRTGPKPKTAGASNPRLSPIAQLL
jgi:hypothetical protein